MIRNILFLYVSDVFRVIAGIFAGVLIVRTLTGIEFVDLMRVQAIMGICSAAPFFLFDQFLIKDYENNHRTDAFLNILVFKLKLCLLCMAGSIVFVGIMFPNLFSLYLIISLNFLIIPIHSLKFFDLLSGRAERFSKCMMVMYNFQLISIIIVAILAPTVQNFVILNVVDNVVLLLAMIFFFRSDIRELRANDIFIYEKKHPQFNPRRGLIIFTTGVVDQLLPRFLLLISPYFHTVQSQTSFAIFTRLTDSVYSALNSLNMAVFLRFIDQKEDAMPSKLTSLIYSVFIAVILLLILTYGKSIIYLLYDYEVSQDSFGLDYFLVAFPIILVLKFIVSDQTGDGSIDKLSFLIFCIVGITILFFAVTSYYLIDTQHYGLVFSGLLAMYLVYNIYFWSR